MVGGFGNDKYDPKPPLWEPYEGGPVVRFDGEGEPGELLFAVKSRSKKIRWLVTIRKFQDGEHSKGEARCACEDGHHRHNPDGATVVDEVCWHIRQILKLARRA